MKFVYDNADPYSSITDFRRATGDCAARAITIATGLKYGDVYHAINDLAKCERKGSRKRGISDARTGVYSSTMKKFMASIGWKWTPTMGIGTGCHVHLRDGELPTGRLVVAVSKHYTAVIDGVIHDTYDPSRPDAFTGQGTRCVYGYWSKE